MNASIELRLATPQDIPAMQAVRGGVRENVLSDPDGLPADSYKPYIETSACWVAFDQGQVVGFSACEIGLGFIWALFVAPDAEGRGLGRALLDQALARLREADHEFAKLSTAPGTRAAGFYQGNGWREAGRTWDGEIIFEYPL